MIAKRDRTAVFVIIAAAIMLIPVLLNGFPFMFPDSGDYLVFTPRIYRSPYYGLFIFFFHMNRWIWLPVIAQSLIVAHLIYLLLAAIGVRRLGPGLILISLLLLLSSAPFFIGFIMADIFTPIMVIGLYLIFFHYGDFNRFTRLYLLALATLAIAAHVSNLTIALCLAPVLALLFAWCGNPGKLLVRRAGLLLIPILLSAAAIFLFNGLIFKTIALTPAGSDFLMANMIQYGPARTYLKSACPQAGYKICADVDRLPPLANDLLWSSGIFDELGGFVSMKDESKKIVDATIRAYPKAVARMVIDNFLAGLMMHEPAAEFAPENQVPSMNTLLEGKFGTGTLNAYHASAEMKNTIPHQLIKTVDSVVVPASFAILAVLGLRQSWKGSRKLAALAFFIIAAVLIDTLLCTAVSGLHDRYQARVTWLLPLACLTIGLSRAPPPAKIINWLAKLIHGQRNKSTDRHSRLRGVMGVRFS